MDILDDNLPIDLPLSNNSIIKVIGVGGGGGNAVNHMYNQGIADVSFVVCNTDIQDLETSPVPIKIQIGEKATSGLGAGGEPQVGTESAEESIEQIKDLLSDNTKMVFVTAGMGGGTGTGASPIVAKVASELGILTVGIVTIPFAFEGKKKIEQAFKGIAKLSEFVDALLVINNEKLKQIHPDLNLSNAFAKADDVLSNAAKAIAEIITNKGHINIDFADVNTIMRKGKVAIMNTGYAEGENRITEAIKNALKSPLLNTNDVQGATKVLLSIYCSREDEIKMEEISQVHQFMESVGDDVTVIWGITFDDSLGKNVKITLIATGFEVSDLPTITRTEIGKPIQTKKTVEKEATTEEERLNTVVEHPEQDNEAPNTEEQALVAEEKAVAVEEEVIITDEMLERSYGKDVITKREVKPEPVVPTQKENLDEMKNLFTLEEDNLDNLEEFNILDINNLDNEEQLEKIKSIPAFLRRRK